MTAVEIEQAITDLCDTERLEKLIDLYTKLTAAQAAPNATRRKS